MQPYDLLIQALAPACHLGAVCLGKDDEGQSADHGADPAEVAARLDDVPQLLLGPQLRERRLLQHLGSERHRCHSHTEDP
jgi:hypothetical protein